MGATLTILCSTVELYPIEADKVAVTDFTTSDPGETLATQVMSAKSLIEAIILTRPHMYDKVNEIDGGAYLLAAWSARHLTWQQVWVKDNQTSIDLIAHDLPGQRGHRFCDKGLVMQVDVDPFLPGMSRGFMVTENFGQVAFLSVGPKPPSLNYLGKWCGVFTGNYRYTYDAGLALAIKSIGMFEGAK